MTVEHCPVLATVGFGKPHLPAGVKWPWLGGGAPISLLQLSSAVAAAKVHNVLAAAFIGFFLPIPLPPIHIPFFVCNTHCEAISVSRCNEWKTLGGKYSSVFWLAQYTEHVLVLVLVKLWVQAGDISE